MAMNQLLTVLLAIGVGLAIGHLAFSSRGDSSVILYSAYGTLSMTFGMVIGAFLILGGFHRTGVVVLAVTYFLARGNYDRFQSERDMRAKAANR
ncbi:hypothetical protein [Natronosalvus amylolyticus]|uniref:hypothetical protein n=1 Tax=Natronosalvus amylolyticus TaxID=2961994 RepID=UPI0020C9D13A|nr:hypothetical protein [Natronosalvus amylolyticus]